MTNGWRRATPSWVRTRAWPLVTPYLSTRGRRLRAFCTCKLTGGRGKTGKLARELLACTGEPSAAAFRQAAVRALEHRLERAERWANCAG